MPSDIAPLDPSYRTIFENPRNGSPQNISKDGCVALARMGAASWNAWRSDFPTLGGVSNHGVAVPPKYGNFANFRDHIFEDFADFSHFNFGAKCYFRER
ncbi:MAG: hypothetical protein GZ093_19095 [Rhodoferax sp.]|uniref:hypothetical protein n=1 Tax=Rhodoferax sp. TaxID=50421 RepID=UPI0013FEE06F|nr:hypothetical protein [Rhodoferax sp.]NDP40805.1 hypothetical protein [Rhodoferax sp.]